jgi:uncharacterized protein HemX
MEPEKKSNGALVGLIVIVIILIIGGIYIWQANKNAINPLEESQVSDQDSTELNTLEQDLETADTEVGVDANAVY